MKRGQPDAFAFFFSLSLFPLSLSLSLARHSSRCLSPHCPHCPLQKEIKAATKEGGKKGQDIAGLADMGSKCVCLFSSFLLSLGASLPARAPLFCLWLLLLL